MPITICETYDVMNEFDNFSQNLTHAMDTVAMLTPNATIVEVVQSVSAMMATWGTA